MARWALLGVRTTRRRPKHRIKATITHSGAGRLKKAEQRKGQRESESDVPICHLVESIGGHDLGKKACVGLGVSCAPSSNPGIYSAAIHTQEAPCMHTHGTASGGPVALKVLTSMRPAPLAGRPGFAQVAASPCWCIGNLSGGRSRRCPFPVAQSPQLNRQTRGGV